MRNLIIGLIHVYAALLPLPYQAVDLAPRVQASVAWPKELDGMELNRIGLSEQESVYYEDFPGQVARFVAGDREVVMRIVDQPTRKLHPSADCLRGSGYRILPESARRDAQGGFWGCVIAEKSDRKLRVCEQIEDSSGQHWYDVSSWYWAAITRQSTPPWRAVTVAEEI